ncbi:MAG: ABC transporter permease [delta proteobacterium ML8_F1]|nr:MAG: ABC transporter permease [delta proteobacterium ML8_F1]
MSINTFFQHLSNGLALGSLYALIAIGYTMVYGILRLINFAHGEIFMISTYVVFYGVSIFYLPWWVSIIVAIVITGLLGIIVERAAYRPLRNSPRISVMISAIGASFLIQNLAIVIFGGRPKSFPIPDYFNTVIQVQGVSVPIVNFFIPVITLVALVILIYIIEKTKTGMAMRAVSRDYETARLMGISVDNIVSITFGLGSLMAAIGGVMWGLKYPNLIPLIGLMPGLKAFIAAVIGGIGNIKGAVLGGFLLGMTEIMIIASLPNVTGYRDAFAFILLIGILIYKPSGLLGQDIGEKV